MPRDNITENYGQEITLGGQSYANREQNWKDCLGQLAREKAKKEHGLAFADDSSVHVTSQVSYTNYVNLGAALVDRRSSKSEDVK